jgi:hypothetical protein
VVDAAQRHADRVWTARHGVETGAALRFASLAARTFRARAPHAVVELATKAAEDESRHAGLCAEVLRARGVPVPPPEARLLEYAPAGLTEVQRLTYEVVAQCCVSETESMATLVTLLEAAQDALLRDVLRVLARDEVAHARVGWGYLAWASRRLDLAFLGPLLPGMVAGSAGEELFRPALPGTDVPALLRWGVVPHRERQRIYLETLEEVVVPGLREHGVDTGPLSDWMQARRAEVAPPAA